LDALLDMLPQLIGGCFVLAVAIGLGLILTWIIKTLYNKIFGASDFPDKFSHALLDTVMFIPGWVIILIGAQAALGVFNFRIIPMGMFQHFFPFIFAAGLILYFGNAWRKARP